MVAPWSALCVWVVVCGCFLRTQQGACFIASANFLSLFGIPLAASEVLGAFCRGSSLFDEVFVGEFDPGSGRTLAACLTHASRAEGPFGVLERRTGE